MRNKVLAMAAVFLFFGIGTGVASAAVPLTRYDVRGVLGTNLTSKPLTANELFALRMTTGQSSICPANLEARKVGPVYQVGSGVTGLATNVVICVPPGDPGFTVASP